MAEPASSRVLVVDDDPVVRLLAVRSMTALGYAVAEAEDGTEALARVDELPPDLILLDVDLPRLGGIETCADLRRRPWARDIPILVTTGLSDAATVERAFEAGATDFIQKPLDWQILQHRVRFLMRAQGAFRSLNRTLSDLRDSQARLANAQRIAQLGSWEWVPGDRTMVWSDQLFRILGVEPSEEPPAYAAFLDSVLPEDRAAVEDLLAKAAAGARTWTLDHRVVTPAGAQRIVRHRIEVERTSAGEVTRIIGAVQDITDRRLAEQQIRYLSNHDTLTALPNRKMLKEYLQRSIGRSRHAGQPTALLFLNLDRFKRINDTLGHLAGDELLKEVAARLTAGVRATDAVGRPLGDDAAPIARLGGDEFAVVLTGLRTSEDAALTARRVLDLLAEPFCVADREVVMTASIGVSVHPTDGGDANLLLGNANSAMRHAKQTGGGSYRFFSPSMNERAMRQLSMEIGLRSALEREQLVVHYQAQRSAHSGQVIGAEALVRWRSDDLGLVRPAEFISIAEESGLIGPLGEWVLRRACAEAREWQQEGRPPLRLAVNVSSLQMRRPELMGIVEGALCDSRFDPRLLELEVTESALLGDDPQLVDNLNALKGLGVRLALDDFGTGFSSLSHLVRFPIDTLKIDQSFVSRIGTGGRADEVVAAVVAMAHRLELCVVAEGVETAQQERFLIAEGCDTLQGFRIGEPLDPAEFAQGLRDGGG
jgi:diguanylate cyclase (GGDEF)-like protein